MNREIRFKGKAINTNEWVYGLLFYGNRIVTSADDSISSYVEKGSPHFIYDYIDVIPGSIGQFSGLHDKNGKEMFEGDIVEYPIHIKLKYIPHYSKDRWIEEVSYSGGSFNIDTDWIEECEIIGNIFESPELIEK